VPEKILDSFDADYRPRLERLDTTIVSDALDQLGLKGSPHGLRPLFEAAKPIVGRAVTVKLVAAGETKATRHACIQAIHVGRQGDVVVVDNGGRLDTNCWGGIVATAAKMKGISGVVADGACRDIDECVELGFPVYARGPVVVTARGRTIEQSTNEMIQIGGIQVRPDDIVMANKSGVVFIPQEHLDAVLNLAEKLREKEASMIADLLGGEGILSVDKKYAYEQMLEKK
jgi:regulator of RNase E activity RraA